MSHALYRTYRSRGFDEVVGQRHVTDLLAAAVKNGTISHAYLFTGPRGTGKTSVARILAHQINDLPYSDDSTHLDIIEIDAASNRRIDDIRDLREKVHIAPSSAKYKVYIIDEVHMLTGESFNALLKTLEEPPEHAVFILATTELHKVPATIVSRTQRFHFRPGSLTDVAAHLRMIADKESIDITDEALMLIAEHSEGGFRDSVSLLDQVSSLDQGKITAEIIEQLLGLAPRTTIENIVDSLADGDRANATTQLQQLLESGVSPQVITQQLAKTLSTRAAENPSLYSILYELVEIPKSYAPHLKLLALLGKPSENTVAHVTAPIAPKRSIESRIVNEPQPSVPAIKTPKEETTKTHKDTPAEPNTQSPEPVAAPTDLKGPIEWGKILDEVRKRTPALHSILKRAEVTILPESITLQFGFMLHRKKMQDEKNRHELAMIVSNLYGACPPIIVTEAGANLDATSQSVADIMGGGEPVKI